MRVSLVFAPSLLKNRVTTMGSVLVTLEHHSHAGHPRREAVVVKTVQLLDITRLFPTVRRC